MIAIFGEMNRRKLKSRMILQVHDELVFDVFRPEVDDLKQILLDKMPAAIPLEVPVVIDINTGNTWLEAH
jgi:DNA polymerase-1